jgi:hypothetical protein
MEMDILNNIDVYDYDSDNYNKKYKFIIIIKLFKDSLFRLRTLSSIILFISIVYKISEFEMFNDNNRRYYYIINNNFIKVLFSAIVFLLNVFVIIISEKNDFKKIYNESI